MRQVWIQIILELKTIRLNRLSIGIGMVALPIAYAMVALLTQASAGVTPSYILSGVLIVSLISSLFSLTILRVSNIFQPDILELYAALPIPKPLLLVGSWLAYILVSIPQASVVFALSALWAPELKLGFSMLALAASYVMIIGVASWLGITIRNPYKAQGVASLVTWLMVLLSPMQPDIHDLPLVLRVVLLSNPTTHAMNLLRFSLGLEVVAPPLASLGFALSIGLVAFPIVLSAARRATIMEKYF